MKFLLLIILLLSISSCDLPTGVVFFVTPFIKNDEIPENETFLFEYQKDSFYISERKNNQTRLITINTNNHTYQFPLIGKKIDNNLYYLDITIIDNNGLLPTIPYHLPVQLLKKDSQYIIYFFEMSNVKDVSNFVNIKYMHQFDYLGKSYLVVMPQIEQYKLFKQDSLYQKIHIRKQKEVK